MNTQTAFLSNRDGFAIFSFNNIDLKFRISDRVIKFVKIKEWDALIGYIVVDCLHDTMGIVEDYIDLLPMLDDLYIDAKKFLKPIKEVEVKNA